MNNNLTEKKFTESIIKNSSCVCRPVEPSLESMVPAWDHKPHSDQVLANLVGGSGVCLIITATERGGGGAGGEGEALFRGVFCLSFSDCGPIIYS